MLGVYSTDCGENVIEEQLSNIFCWSILFQSNCLQGRFGISPEKVKSSQILILSSPLQPVAVNGIFQSQKHLSPEADNSPLANNDRKESSGAEISHEIKSYLVQ